MNDQPGGKLLLGEKVAAPTAYAPDVLFAIPRAAGRESLDAPMLARMHGYDIWHAYEMSWLDESGRPRVGVGRFRIPASSPNIVESKSLKLYLNSLNNERYPDEESVRALVERDVSAVIGEGAEIEILDIDAPQLFATAMADYCLDDLPIGEIPVGPDASILVANPQESVSEVLVSHLLRSLCPVTGQPDWASIRIDYTGPALDHSRLLTYLLSYREHQEFHEQCVERIFCDLLGACQLEQLTVQAFYTRRGGLDINPLRSTEPEALAGPRLLRQ